MSAGGIGSVPGSPAFAQVPYIRWHSTVGPLKLWTDIQTLVTSHCLPYPYPDTSLDGWRQRWCQRASLIHLPRWTENKTKRNSNTIEHIQLLGTVFHVLILTKTKWGKYFHNPILQMRKQAQGIGSLLKITYLDSDKAVIQSWRVRIWVHDINYHERLFPSYKSWNWWIRKNKVEQIKPKTGSLKRAVKYKTPWQDWFRYSVKIWLRMRKATYLTT